MRTALRLTVSESEGEADGLRGESRAVAKRKAAAVRREKMLDLLGRQAGRFASALDEDDVLSEAALATVLHPDGAPAPPVDLFLRTGGEQRLSDFLLWESAYAELLFLDTMWPDMTGAALAGAIADFHTRTRRFGGLVAA